MAQKRTSKPVLAKEYTQEELDTILSEYATSSAKLNVKNSNMELELTNIRKKYTTELAELIEKNTEAYQKLQAYYEGKKEELFPRKKSIDTIHGKIGFQMGQPSVKPISKSYTWESIKTLVKEFLPEYLRTVEEVNKEALLADRDNTISVEMNPELEHVEEELRPKVSTLYAKCGIKIHQEERFFIELKQ